MLATLRSLAVALALTLAAGTAPADADKKKSPPPNKKTPPKAQPKHKPAAKGEHHHRHKTESFHGMIVMVSGSSINIKHSNGTGKTFDAAKAAISGQATSLQGLKKGQLVTVHHVGKEARKVNVEKQPAASPKLRGKVEHYAGTVEKIQTDQFGDNGAIWVKGHGGVKRFGVHNETNIDYKQGGKTIVHTLQGVTKGMKVKVRHQGNQATHVDVVK
jgi:hypothetical protein